MYSYPSIRLQVPLGKDEQKINSETFSIVARSFLAWMDLASPSFKGFWICKLAHVWKFVERI